MREEETREFIADVERAMKEIITYTALVEKSSVLEREVFAIDTLTIEEKETVTEAVHEIYRQRCAVERQAIESLQALAKQMRSK